MPNFFADGKRAFNTKTDHSWAQYTKNQTPTTREQHLEAAKGYATMMAKSEQGTGKNDATVSRKEFLDGLKFDDEANGEAIVKLLFNNKATISIDEAAELMVQLDESDKSGRDGVLSESFQDFLDDSLNASDFDGSNFNNLIELIKYQAISERANIFKTALTSNANADLNYSKIGDTEEYRWQNALEYTTSLLPDGKTALDSAILQTNLGINQALADALIKKYGGDTATSLTPRQAATLLYTEAGDDTWTGAERRAAEAALSTTARGTTTTNPAGTTTTTPAGTTTTTPAAASQTRGNGLFGWRNWFKKKDKTNTAGTNTGTAGAANNTSNTNNTAALTNTDPAAANNDAKTPGTIQLFGKEIKTKNLLLFGGLGVGLLALLGVFKKKQQPMANAGACCPPSPYAEILSFGGASSSRGVQGPLNVMQF